MPNSASLSDSATGLMVTPATIGSTVLLVSFFLPWIKFFGKPVGGYQLREIWSVGPYLWSIPVLSLAVIVLGLCRKNNARLGRLLGALPFIFLAIALYQIGRELFSELYLGAWLTLLSGGFLLLGLARSPVGSSNTQEENPHSSSHENR